MACESVCTWTYSVKTYTCKTDALLFKLQSSVKKYIRYIVKHSLFNFSIARVVSNIILECM